MPVRVIVIGGGIIGIACAIALQRRDYDVTIVDRAQPGMDCSFGNAGMIATSEVAPIISPRRVIGLPRMLLDRDGPAVIRASSLGTLLPWLLRAASTLTSTRQRAISAALGRLNVAALPAWRAMLKDIGASDLLFENGMIEVLRSPAPAGMASHARQLTALGLGAQLLSGDEIRELEPGISPACTGGLYHPGTAHVRDPFEVAEALLRAFRDRGGQLLRDEVIGIEAREIDQTVHGRAASYHANALVVAAGMASGRLLRQLGATAPLQAERGYHLMLPGVASWLSRPLTFHRESCVAVPLGGGLRLAGTVEFAHPDAPPDWSRADRLAEFAQRYFRDILPTGQAGRWIGSRPSLPDSLPAIGLLPGRPKLAYAFGHQHLGLTQAAITARHVADLITAGCGSASLAEFDIRRFRSFDS